MNFLKKIYSPKVNFFLQNISYLRNIISNSFFNKHFWGARLLKKLTRTRIGFHRRLRLLRCRHPRGERWDAVAVVVAAADGLVAGAGMAGRRDLRREPPKI
jgi:hypothetical protein